MYYDFTMLTYFCEDVVKLNAQTYTHNVLQTLNYSNLPVGRSQTCSKTGSSSRSKRYTYERAGATAKRGSVNSQELLQTCSKIL